MSDSPLRTASPEIHALWEESRVGIDRTQIEADLAKSAAAAAEDSFSGFVRRCIRHGSRPISLIAEDARVDVQRLAAFLHGEEALDTTEVDRLLATLGVELLACGKA